RPGQHASSHVPEPDPVLRPGDKRVAVLVAGGAVPAACGAGRGGGGPVRLAGPRRAGPRPLDHDERPPVRRAPGPRGPVDAVRPGGIGWRAERGVVVRCPGGSLTRPRKAGGLPPDSVVEDDGEVLADSERRVRKHPAPAWGAMVRVALAPCSPFSVSPELMR